MTSLITSITKKGIRRTGSLSGVVLTKMNQLKTETPPHGVTRRRRSNGHNDIVAILGSEIISGARVPGSRLPSAAELYERFGVSRVLLREVTKTLEAKGMITAKARVGTSGHCQPNGAALVSIAFAR